MGRVPLGGQPLVALGRRLGLGEGVVGTKPVLGRRGRRPPLPPPLGVAGGQSPPWSNGARPARAVSSVRRLVACGAGGGPPPGATRRVRAQAPSRKTGGGDAVGGGQWAGTSGAPIVAQATRPPSRDGPPPRHSLLECAQWRRRLTFSLIRLLPPTAPSRAHRQAHGSTWRDLSHCEISAGSGLPSG
jgi:hypothetical protein